MTECQTAYIQMRWLIWAVSSEFMLFAKPIIIAYGSEILSKSKIVADDSLTMYISLLFFKENKAWHYMHKFTWNVKPYFFPKM